MYLYVDIETIPGPNKPTIAEIERLAPGNMSKPETIRKWAEENVDNIYRKQALDSMKGVILCIAWAFDDEEPSLFYNLEPQSPISIGEQVLICSFMKSVEPFMSKYGSMRPMWVGHNARSFDLTWLWRKAMKYRLYNLAQRIPRDRYSKDVEDTMEMWASDYKDHVSLDSVAQFLGVGGKNGMNGGMVYDYFIQGRHNDIAEYCKDDVKLVREVHKVLTGMVSSDRLVAVNE